MAGLDHNPADLLVDNLSLLDEIARVVSRRRRFTSDEADEFAATVRLRMVEGDYRILRAFRGNSSLRTYLVAVVQRLALDFLIQRTGKWRPSAAARRLGPVAVQLEQLLGRDRLSLEAACRRLLAEPGTPVTRDEILDLARRLPVRLRARITPVDAADLDASPGARTPLTDLERREAADTAGAVERVFDEVMSSLPAEDRLLLRLRFESGLTVPQVASILGGRAKPLYKRTEWLLERLRRALDGAGLTRERLDDTAVVGRMVDLWGGAPGEDPGSRPSPPDESATGLATSRKETG